MEQNDIIYTLDMYQIDLITVSRYGDLNLPAAEWNSVFPGGSQHLCVQSECSTLSCPKREECPGPGFANMKEINHERYR